jgi:hypothetical protein
MLSCRRAAAAYRRALLPLGLVVLLVGCGQGTRLVEPATSFDRQSADAIVIVGIEANKTTNLLFTLYDPATHNLAGTDVATNGFSAKSALFDHARMTVHRVKPGTYALFEITISAPQRDMSTGLMRAVPVTTKFGRRDRALPGGGAINADAPSFTVGAGEIVYVGDFVVNNAYALGPSRVEAVKLDEAAARAVLARYPNIKGEMQMRHPYPAGRAKAS